MFTLPHISPYAYLAFYNHPDKKLLGERGDGIWYTTATDARESEIT